MQMNELIIGNLFSCLAMVVDSVSSTRKRAKDVLLFQALSQFIYLICSIVLKGYSAAVQNAVSVLRNLAAVKKDLGKALEWTLVILGVVLGLWFNNRGIFGLLPVIANLEYSLAVFRFKEDERLLKIAFAICIVLYAIFNLIILNFIGAISNLVVLVVTINYLIKNKKKGI